MKESIYSNGDRQPSYHLLSKPSCSASHVGTSTINPSHQMKKSSRSSDAWTNSTPRLPSSDHESSSPSWRRRTFWSEGTESETIARKWDSKPSTRSQICLNQGWGRNTKSIHICSETSPLIAPTKSGAWTSPTFGWPQAGCIWSPSLTGTADTLSPGRSQKHSSCPSSWTAATKRWARRCRRLSTQIKGAISRLNASRAASRRRERESPWTVEAATWTTFSPNASGDLSSMRRST